MVGWLRGRKKMKLYKQMKDAGFRTRKGKLDPLMLIRMKRIINSHPNKLFVASDFICSNPRLYLSTLTRLGLIETIYDGRYRFKAK
jgi:hypothetical protein